MTTISTGSGHVARHDRFVQERRHDSYKMPCKLNELTSCKACGALCHKGHWTWVVKPARADEIVRSRLSPHSGQMFQRASRSEGIIPWNITATKSWG